MIDGSHPAVMLVGAGVVGRAIARDHLRAGIPVWMADQNEAALRAACDETTTRGDGMWVTATPWGAKIPLPVIGLSPGDDPDAMRSSGDSPEWLVIESIAERLDVKQAFFADAVNWFERPPILTSNTSTLSIRRIAESLANPGRLAGLHFFMPVVGRHAAELIAHDRTDADVIARCQGHCRALGKTPLSVGDGPGFVVNRMLAPYLNLSLWLVCGGIDFATLRRAAIRFGMPISPLELIDWIGARTAFDAGRVVWSAFPHRLTPSPLLPAMVKRGHTGRGVGEGFYRYQNDERVDEAPRETIVALIDRYRHGEWTTPPNVAQIAEMMAGVMGREADAIIRDAVADAATIDAAMAGGLGFHRPGASFIDHARSIDIDALASRYPAMISLK